MSAERGYDIFPRTWKARVLLALAFVGGLAVSAVWVLLLIVQSVDVLSFQRPCSGSDLERCLEPQVELDPIATDGCEGDERRVCLVPLGRVSTDLIHYLVGHYRDEYGLRVIVLKPSSIPRNLVDDDREQIDAVSLITYMLDLHPDAANDPDAILIGLTPVDIYNSRSHYRFLFGLKGDLQHPEAVLSTYRMDLRTYTYGLVADDDLMFSRASKLVTKYIGMLYYGLPPSDDPSSPLFDSILSTADLDKMSERLDVSISR